jgi:hypothetical protein
MRVIWGRQMPSPIAGWATANRRCSASEAGWWRSVRWGLLRSEDDLSVGPLPSERIEFGPQPDDFRCKGDGCLGELSQHHTNLWINRDYFARFIIGHLGLLASRPLGCAHSSASLTIILHELRTCPRTPVEWHYRSVDSARLSRENAIVLSVVEALCGSMTADVKAVTIQFPFDDVVVNFLLRSRSNHSAGWLLDDFPTEVAVLTMGIPEVGDVRVTPQIEYLEDREADYVPPGRRVLLIRDPERRP